MLSLRPLVGGVKLLTWKEASPIEDFSSIMNIYYGYRDGTYGDFLPFFDSISSCFSAISYSSISDEQSRDTERALNGSSLVIFMSGKDEFLGFDLVGEIDIDGELKLKEFYVRAKLVILGNP